MRTQLVVFGTLLSAAVILLSFGAVSIEIRRQTRALLADTVGRNQGLLIKQQRNNLAQLVSTSGVITSNPTLRAAIETYRSESSTGAAPRADLLATIQVEALKIGAMLGKDALVITDEQGRVLAATGRARALPAIGDDLSAWPAVARALDADARAGDGSGVVSIDGEAFQIGCVPIELQGYVIGTLVLGDAINAQFLRNLQEATDGEVAIVADGQVLAATPGLANSIRGPGFSATLAAVTDAHVSRVVRIGSEEYVTAGLPLGAGPDGRPVTLHLLSSLSQALERPRKELLWTLLVHSLIAVALAGAMAWLVSGSILRPLERFVAFLEHVTRTGEYGHRITDEGGPVEVQRLRATYNHMIDTLMSDFLRIERLRESEKMAALGRMLSGAAHEINNPLTGVVGHVDLLLGRTDVDPAVRRPLETVQRDAHRVAALVRNLLKTSHRDEGKRAVADVNRMLRDAVSLRQHDFVNNGIGLALDLAPGTLPVLGNELALQQVFVNIIGNAYDALREAGGARHLTIVTTRQAATTVITFADDGPGMKNPERVFEPFYTTKGVGKGTGLGLSLSFATVHDHGGVISATNRDGGGACFTVRLPVAADVPARAAGDPAAGPRTPRPREDTALAPGWSVLVVDDEPSVLDVQVQILTAMGARVTGVANAADALTALGGGAFDLVISDMKMPGGMSGPDLYRWTREHLPAFAGCFLFVTGDTFAASADEFLRDSELPYLMKPFSIDEYTAHVQEVLRDARRAA